MKTNVFKKKLVLKKETIAHLEDLEMKIVQGGNSILKRSCVYTCNTLNGTVCIGMRTDCPCP